MKEGQPTGDRDGCRSIAGWSLLLTFGAEAKDIKLLEGTNPLQRKLRGNL